MCMMFQPIIQPAKRVNSLFYKILLSERRASGMQCVALDNRTVETNHETYFHFSRLRALYSAGQPHGEQ